jgi:hypothetical protein
VAEPGSESPTGATTVYNPTANVKPADIRRSGYAVGQAANFSAKYMIPLMGFPRSVRSAVCSLSTTVSPFSAIREEI